MSKADTLGPAPSFGAVRSARRRAISNIGGDDSTTAITELPVTQISENPDNPRNHLRNLDETVESVREVGIILPIVVAAVDAYLRDRPDRAEDLDDGAQYVVVDGHRRLEASRRVGLATIPVRVDNARVATDESLLEAAFVANYHRDDMTELEEAHALKQLVDYYGGSQTKACKRLSISPSTLSSKLSLLKLTPELQKDLMTGERKVEHVRNLGKLTPDAQKEKADERAEASRSRSQVRSKPAAGLVSGPADFHAVNNHGQVTDRPADSGPPASPRAEGPTPAASPQGADTPPADGIPEPRDATHASPAAADAADRPPVKFPYDDGSSAAYFLIHRMPPTEFDKMLEALLEHKANRQDAATH